MSFLCRSAILLVLVTGCATMIRGTRQQIPIRSTPAGATVSTGTQSLVTPGTLTLERDQLHEVTITKAGYVTAHRCIAPRQDGVIWGNLAFGGVVGILVDQGDGAVYALDPEEMDVTLVPEDPDAAGR
jgi:hypothetical protein